MIQIVIDPTDLIWLIAAVVVVLISSAFILDNFLREKIGPWLRGWRR
jgi:hypothetical protein